MTDSHPKYVGRFDGDSHHRGKRSVEDVRKRPLPDLSLENDSLNLRIVYPKTLYVVGVGKDLSNPDVDLLETDSEAIRQPGPVRRHRGRGHEGEQLR